MADTDDDKPGDRPGMDITEQERTFSGFMVWVVRALVVIVAVLLFLALFTI
jgi:positive regulator of sigma E activity